MGPVSDASIPSRKRRNRAFTVGIEFLQVKARRFEWPAKVDPLIRFPSGLIETIPSNP
jgi:hypothetical protein